MPQDATVRSRQKEIISLVLEKFEYKPFQLFNASIETIPELVEALLRLRSEQKEFAFDQFMTEYRAVRHLIDQDKGGDLDVKRGYVRMIRRLQSRFPKECELFSVEENLGFELIGRLDATIFKDLNKRWLKLKKDNKRVFLMDEIETAFDTISRQNKLSVPEIGRKEFNEKVDEFAKTELVDFSDAMKRNSNAFVKGAIRPGSDLFLRIQEQAHSPGNRNQVYKEMMLRSLLKLGKKVLQICKQFELCEHCLSRGHDSDDCRDLCYDLQEYINPSAYEETTDVRVSLNKRFVTASQWEKEDIILRVIRNKQRKRRRVE